MRFVNATTIGILLLAACSPTSSASQLEGHDVAAVASQRADGQPYEIPGTQVFDVPDGARSIPYQIFVSLPSSYYADATRHYPVVYVTDADYAFPIIRNIGRRMNGAGPRVEEFILVGLSYAMGEDSMASRRRDYTPTANGADDAPDDARHGESAAYMAYLRDSVIPYVEQRWRTRPNGRIYAGHSYGGLLGAQILLTHPTMFNGYLLGSPSFWYDRRYLLNAMPELLARQEAIAAQVYMYVGEFEALRPGDRRYQQEVNMVSDNAAFASMLQAQHRPGLSIRSEVLEDDDHLSVAPRGFTRGLVHLLPASRP